MTEYQISDRAIQWFSGMRNDLRDFYEKVGKKLSDRSLFIEIERQFGPRISQEICIPNKIYSGECILAAIKVAKGEDSFDMAVA